MEIHHRLRATDVSPYAQATALASRMGIYERRVSLLLFVHARCGAIHRGYRLGIRFLLGRHLASVFVSGWSAGVVGSSSHVCRVYFSYHKHGYLIKLKV
jgi:hypothetical protein